MVKVMFVCTGNSCRSQMAEGFARELGKGIIEANSAGLSPKGVHKKSIEVMKEIGTDISKQVSKSINNELLKKMDIVITLCNDAAEFCPWTPPEIKKLHWQIEDPAKAEGTEEEILHTFRNVRDEIKEQVMNFIKEIQDG